MDKYTEIADPKLQARIRSRYAREIAALQALGFRILVFKRETRGPFSVLSHLAILPLMYQANEILVFPFPLRLALASVLLVHSEPPSIAMSMGLGVKFFTNFSDHTLLISSTLRSHAGMEGSVAQESEFQIVRNPPSQTMEEAWLSHKRRISEMESLGKTVRNSGSFADYVEASERESAELKSRMR